MEGMKLSAMRISGVVLTAIALAVVPSAYSADSIEWGRPVNGLRLGAAFGSDPSKPILRVLLQNVGPAVQELVIGHSGPSYDSMKFIATAPDGKEEVGLHKGVYIPIAGLVLPISVSLNAGTTHELELPLKDIIFASRTTTTLDVLVKKGYSVRVRFEAFQAEPDWPKLSTAKSTNVWIATVSSGEVSPTR
jgi:hypothetical protein